jgi:hypothetical protein
MKYNVSRRQAFFIFMATDFTTISALAAEKEQQEMSDDARTYFSNGILLDNFGHYWPKPHKTPQLILDLAALIGPWPWGVLGHFNIIASRPNDFLMENGADLWSQFGGFLSFANGTEYSLWYYDGCPPGAEPVVAFGDEGGFKMLAPNLKTFFMLWASGQGSGMPAPSDVAETPEDLARFKDFGSKVMAFLKAFPDVAVPASIPDISDFMDDFGSKAFARNADDPTLQAIAKLMAAHFPPDNNNPRGNSFTLTAVGDDMTVETKLMEPDYTQYEPLPERDALIPLVKQARMERASTHTDGRGPWKSGVLYLQHGGHAFISGEWEY